MSIESNFKTPEIFRRNAAIALANTVKAGKEALTALKDQLDGVSSGLKEYFTWAIEKIKRNEVKRIRVTRIDD